MNTLLAIGWEPELRGLLTVIIGTVVFCGSAYLILGTNVGARLGFLLTFTGLAGWMAIMGFVWAIYGLGLKGPEPSWEPVAGRTVIQEPQGLVKAGVLDSIEVPDGASPTETATAIGDEFQVEDWTRLAEADPIYGDAGAAAGAIVESTETLAAGEYVVTGVFDTGGERYPKIGDTLDFLAFFHKPHYVVVEVTPLEPTVAEPGRAPAVDVPDDSQPRQYVYMVRDLGAMRQPAIVLTVGSTLILLGFGYLLHRRDALVARNREATATG